MKKTTTIRIFESQFSVNLILVGILLLGLILKGIYLYSYAHNSPYYSSGYFDSAVYLNWAQLISQEGWLGKEIFYWAPFYPYLLSIILRILPNKLLTIYVVQLILGLCSVGLIYLIGKRIYNERAALIGASFSLAYAPLTFFETKILPTVTGIFLGSLFVYLLTRAEQENKWLYWVGGAATLGFATICRPNYILVIPLLILGLLIFHRKELSKVYLCILILVLTPSIIIGTVTLRNFVVGKDFVPISANAGVTFAQGNNPWARGSMVILPEFSGEVTNQRYEETQIAERVMGRKLKPSEVNRFWFKWGLNFIRQNPLSYLELLFGKIAILLNSFELGSNYLQSIDKELTPFLRIAFLPFGFIMAWAIVGVALIFRQRPPALTLVATFIGSLLMLLLFYVNSRYRMTLAPAAIIMAGGGLDYLLRRPKRSMVILILVAIIFFLSLPQFMPLNEAQLSRSHAAAWAHLGTAYKNNKNLEKALWAYEGAISKDPENYRHYLEKIILLGKLDNSEDEIMIWLNREINKISAEEYRDLVMAEAFYSAKNYDKAEQYVEKIISSTSQDYKLYLHSGILFGRIGKHLRAKAALAKGLEYNPNNIDLQFNYALACFHLGENELATIWANRIISRAPYHRRARILLKQIREKQ
jgi:tetratricopeptide (TPR) repeat protein